MISYRPLKDLLYHNNIFINELVEAKILTPNNSVNINKDKGYLNLRTVDRVITYLNKRLDQELKIDDVLKYIPDN